MTAKLDGSGFWTVDSRGKVGGMLNFIPKSARSEDLTRPVGEVEATFGSYDEKSLNSQFGAPFSLGGVPGGVYAYGEVDDSHSFYRGIHPRRQLGEVSVKLDVTAHRFSGAAKDKIVAAGGTTTQL